MSTYVCRGFFSFYAYARRLPRRDGPWLPDLEIMKGNTRLPCACRLCLYKGCVCCVKQRHVCRRINNSAERRGAMIERRKELCVCFLFDHTQHTTSTDTGTTG